MTRVLASLLFVTTAATATAQTLSVTGRDRDLANVVVTARLSDPMGIGFPVLGGVPGSVPAPAVQFTGLTGKEREIVFVLPRLKAGSKLDLGLLYTSPPPGGAQSTSFHFAETRHHSTALLFGDRLVLDYINEAHNGSSKESHFRTFKPFHHVYDPATGKVELTSGVYPQSKEYQYPHHRGLFFGFNRISYGDKQTADTWHGTDGVFSQHDKVLATEAGPVFGRQVSAISWHGKDGKPFANEERSVTAYNVEGGTLIDWSTTLSTELPRVRLDGDPQHAGFHFRAAQEVAKNGKQNTFFLRPDGKGKVGETRNWDAKKQDPRTVNLPWNAMSFVVEGKRYTVLRINDPDNPKETRGSERDYGRFGDYFEYTLTPDKPLKLKYRVWVQEGEMTVEQCEAMARGFVSPPEVKVAAGQ